MKLTEINIDKKLLDKINRLDPVVSAYNNNLDGNVAYDGDKFYIKKTNDTFLRKILSDDDIAAFRSHIKLEELNYINSYNSCINTNNVCSKYTKNNRLFMPTTTAYSTEDNIVYSKALTTGIVIEDKNGKVTKFDSNTNIEYIAEIVPMLRDNFVIANIDCYSILDIEECEDGLLISTDLGGIYVYNKLEDSLELIINASNVRYMKITDANKLFCASDTGVFFYDIESGLCTSSNYNMKNLVQQPAGITTYGRDIMLLGRNYGCTNIGRALHVWKEDIAKVGYNNIDSAIKENPHSNKYFPKFIDSDKHSVYIVGLYGEQRFFVWKYNIDNYYREYEEFIFDLDLENLTYFGIKNENFIFADKDKILVYDEHNNIVENIKTDENIDNIILSDSDFIIVYKYGIKKVPYIAYNDDTIITYTVYDSDISCNNIDVYISGATTADEIVFVDATTMDIITPTFQLNKTTEVLYKILNCTAKKIYLRLNIRGKHDIAAVVVKANRLYFR